jgi:hypothetical protein
MIVERVKAGLKRTKAEGKVLGRPPEGGARHASDGARIGHRKLYGSAHRGCMRGLKSFGYAWLDREGARGGQPVPPWEDVSVDFPPYGVIISKSKGVPLAWGYYGVRELHSKARGRERQRETKRREQDTLQERGLPHM